MKQAPRSEEIVILGLDPGLANVGYGVIRSDGHASRCLEYGCFQTRADQDMASRLRTIYEGLEALVVRTAPILVGLETLYFAKNTRSAMAVAQARGVAIAAVAGDGVEVVDVTPLQVKQALTGYGRADKSQIQRMAQMLLGLDAPPRPDHAADALAVALACAHSLTRRRRLAP